MNVPLVDLKRRYLSVKREVNEGIKKVISDTSFIKGNEVKILEDGFASYCNKKYGVGCANGTVALHLGLLALGIKSGDEVITVPNTFIATTEAISHIGAQVKFVDVEKDTMVMNPALLKKAINKKTKAIIPVHLYGQIAEMDPIIEIADKYGLQVIEDCAQCHGAEQHNKKAPHTDIGAFSFFPAKIIGAFGDAGIVVTNNKEYAEKMKMLSDHGRREKYVSEFEGFNYRLDTIQAAVLNTYLKKLDSWVERRREIAKIYNNLLGGVVETPYEKPHNKHSYYMYVIKVKNRDGVLKKLNNLGVSASIHYPVPLHLQPAYKHLGLREGAFPVTEECAKEIISLPIFPEMRAEEIDYVISCVKKSL